MRDAAPPTASPLARLAPAPQLDPSLVIIFRSSRASSLKTTFAAVLALTLCASAARAQGPTVRPLPAAGEMIRVTPASGEPFTGRLAALGGDTLVLAGLDGGPGVRVVASQQRVEIQRRHRERWSALGAVAGIAAGVAVKAIAWGSDGSPHAVAESVVSGAAGALVGGVVGFSVAPRRWQPLRATAPAALPPPVRTAETERR